MKITNDTFNFRIGVVEEYPYTVTFTHTSGYEFIIEGLHAKNLYDAIQKAEDELYNYYCDKANEVEDNEEKQETWDLYGGYTVTGVQRGASI